MIKGKKDALKKTNATVVSWLNQRTDLLKQYYKFSSNTTTKLATPGKLKEFRDTLIDYVSSGHFCVYETLVKKSQLQQQHKTHVYAQISQTTEIALTFNDKYETFDWEESSDVFTNDLSILGEAISIRLELEDSLLSSL